MEKPKLHLNEIIGNYRVSTIKLIEEPNAFRFLTSLFTGHKEAPYETCIFFLNTQPRQSNVIGEYSQEDKAIKGHKKVCKLIRSGKPLAFKDLFTKENVFIN